MSLWYYNQRLILHFIIMRTIYSLLIPFLLNGSLYSQITYSRIYHVASSGLRFIDNGINNYTFYSVSKGGVSGYYLNRNIFTTDFNGAALDTNTIYIPNRNIYGDSKVLVIVRNYIFSGSVAFPNHAASYIIFTDSNFTKTKQIIYGDTVGSTYTFQTIDDACRLSSGDMMFCGEEYDTNTASDSKIQLIKTDSAGNLIWKKNYSYQHNNRGWFIEATPDGGAIVGGNSFDGRSLQGQLRTYDAVVLKVDSAGNEQWHKKWGNPYLNDDWAVVQNAGDGNYIVATAYAEWDTIMNNYTDKSHRDVNVIKLDSIGNEIWNKKYCSVERTRQLSRLVVLPNNNIVVIGNYIKLDAIHLPHQYTRAWILMLNANGDSLFYKEYTHYISNGVENILNDIKPTPDGGYICCGEFSDGFNGIAQSLWVLKLDSTGWYYGMSVESSKFESFKFKVFPNPAADFTTVDLTDFAHYGNLSLHLSDAELKELDIIPVESNAKSKRINLSNYPPGVYFIRLQNGAEILGVEKIIKN